MICGIPAASYVAISGASLVDVDAILGHKTLAMVKRYSHMSEQHTIAGTFICIDAGFFVANLSKIRSSCVLCRQYRSRMMQGLVFARASIVTGVERRSGIVRLIACRGFTLIEIFIGVLIVAILTALALPAYQRYINQTKIAVAKVDIAMMSAVIQKANKDGTTYPASLADVNLDTKLDPWGRPYVYYNIAANGKGHARKDHALNPLNRDYDLYSVGPDGKSKPQITQKDSLDDVIRANDGAFIGVAADF